MGELREGVWVWFWWAAAAMAGLAAVDWAVRRGHGWWWTKGMDAGRKGRLPAGDMGWPLVGGMWAFLRAFKSGDPDAFINSFHHRYLLPLLFASCGHESRGGRFLSSSAHVFRPACASPSGPAWQRLITLPCFLALQVTRVLAQKKK